MSNIPFHVAVVGAGASGTLVAANFKRFAPQGRLALIGNSPRPGKGVAYDTMYCVNLLNVPAGNMSAFPDEMTHFVDWLKTRLPDSNAGTFAPRIAYGDYLADIFSATVKDNPNIDYVEGDVISVTREHEYWKLQLKNGSTIFAHAVVLAFGNLLAPNDPIDFHEVKSLYWKNPWSEDVALGLEKDAPVLLVGTGLTMVDVALSLREVGHRGTIHTLSRNGRLYQVHKPYQPRPLADLPDDLNSPRGAIRWIREQVAIAEHTGSDWRAVIDSLRPHTAAIWQKWTLTQRQSFLRHARNLWDIHRHRMSPEVADQLGTLVEDRVLKIHRGKLVSAKQNGNLAQVTWEHTDTKERSTLDVARIVNCTGPSRDYSKIESPLIAQLIKAGLIVPDQLRLGFDTDQDGRFVNVQCEPVQGLFTLGPVRIPGLWESLAIPEIRNQAKSLAKLLVDETIEAGIPA
jgi:uncharacterized NAD(P)/FAD-binding protein YdhS